MSPIAVEILHTGGHYPAMVEEHLRAQGAPVASYQVPADCFEAVDHPEAYLPPELGQAAVLIAVALPAALLTALPKRLADTNCRALIVPVEDPSWLRPGPALLLERACQAAGLECEVPVPFCALVPSSETITEFCEQYRLGRPRLHMSSNHGTLTEVDCLRGSPCGLTNWVADQLLGLRLEDVLTKARVCHHARPCLASMALVPETGDTLMHASVDILTAAVAKTLKQAQGGCVIGLLP
jgi:hypothetical protein